MNKELYNKYKHLPLKPGHKWMCVFDSKDVRIVVDSNKEKGWVIFVRMDHTYDYFENKIYFTKFSDVFCDMPESIIRPMTFEEAVKLLWDLQQKGPVIMRYISDIDHNGNINMNYYGPIISSTEEISNREYSTDLGKTWHRFEVEE